MARPRSSGDVGLVAAGDQPGVTRQAAGPGGASSGEPTDASRADQTPRRRAGRIALRLRRSPRGRLAAQAAASALLAVLLGVAYEGPVANFMERTRQRHLAAAFVVPGKVVAGGPFALLQIGRIHLNAMVGEGDSVADLRSGPGHRIGSPSPGQPGEALIVGLSSRYGAPFAGLDRLMPGDVIIVQDKNGSGRPLAFDVSETSVVGSSAAGPPAVATPSLALVTQASSTPGRALVVVRANLVAGTQGRGARSPEGARPAGARAGYYAAPPLGTVDAVAPALWAILGLAVLGARRWLAPDSWPLRLAVVVPVAALAWLEVLLSADRLIRGGG